MKRLTIINGANLNLLGSRETSIYGDRSFEDYLEELKKEFPQVEFTYRQSNIEGELVNFLQEACGQDGVIINAGGYTHTSVVIADAVRSIAPPVVEVHISNIFARENYRHNSFLSPYCRGCIVGLGLQGYALAVRSLL